MKDHPLAGDPHRGLHPGRVRCELVLVRLHEAIDAPALQSLGEPVPVREDIVGGGKAERHRARQDERSHLVGMVEGVSHGGVAAHRMPGEDRAPTGGALGQHGSQVARQLLVVVSAPRGRRGGLAVTTRV